MSQWIDYSSKIASVSPDQVIALVENQLKSTDFVLPNLELTEKGVYCKGRHSKALDGKAKAYMSFNWSNKYKSNICWVYVISFNTTEGEIAKASSLDVLKTGAEIYIKNPEQLERERVAREAKAKIQAEKDAQETARKSRIAKQTYTNGIPTTYHPYFVRKQVSLEGVGTPTAYPVKTHKSDRAGDDSNMLVIPLVKWVNGSLVMTGIQRIYADGVKKGLGQTTGSFYPLGKIENPTEIYVCGGLATALTVYKALTEGLKKENILVINAVADGNIPDSKQNEPRVFAALVDKYPNLYKNSKITFVADLDMYPTSKGIIPNKGFLTASELQNQYPLALVSYQPIINDAWYNTVKPTDFNDVFCLLQTELGETEESVYQFIAPYLDAGLTRSEFKEVFDFQDGKVIEPINPIIAKIEASVHAVVQVQTGQRSQEIETLLADARHEHEKNKHLAIVVQQELNRRQQWIDSISPYSTQQKELINLAVAINPETGYSFVHQLIFLQFWPESPEKAKKAIETAMRERGYKQPKLAAIDYAEDNFARIPVHVKDGNHADYIQIAVKYSKNKALKQYAYWLVNEKNPIYTTQWLPSPALVHAFAQNGLTWKKLFEANAVATKFRNLKGKIELHFDKYLPNSKEDLPQDGVFAYQTPTGSGKTELAASIREDCKSKGVSFVSIAQLRTLVESNANRMHVALYSYQAETNGFTQERIVLEGSAITFHSVHKLEEIQVHTVFIDEFSQTRKTLVSEPMMQNQPEKNLAVFEKKIREAKRVVVADAFMRPEDIEWLAKLRGCSVNDITVYAKFGGKENYVQHMHQSKESALSALKSYVQNGGYAYVPCSSKQDTEDFKSLLIELGIPEKEIFVLNEETRRLTDENAENNPAMDFINDPTKHIDNYRIVITSPVVNSGMSIPEFEGRKPRKVFGFFTNYVSTASDSFQMEHRYRTDELESHVFYDFKDIQSYHDVNLFTKIMGVAPDKTEVFNMMKNGEFSWDTAKSWHEEKNRECERYTEDAFEIAESLRKEQNNARNELIELAILQGIQLRTVTTDAEQTAHIKADIGSDIAKAKEAFIDRDVQRLNAVEKIYIGEYERLTNIKNRDLTQAETLQIREYKYRNTYGITEITLDVIKLDQKGKTPAKLRKLIFAMAECRNTQLKLQIQLQKDLLAGHVSQFVVKKNPLLFADSYHWLFDRIQAATGLHISFDDGQIKLDIPKLPFRAFSDGKCLIPELSEIFDRIKNDADFKREIEAFTHLKIPNGFDRDMRWFIRLLDCFDLKLSHITEKAMKERFGVEGRLHGEKYYFLEPQFKSAHDDATQELLMTALQNLTKDVFERYQDKLKYID